MSSSPAAPPKPAANAAPEKGVVSEPAKTAAAPAAAAAAPTAAATPAPGSFTAKGGVDVLAKQQRLAQSTEGAADKDGGAAVHTLSRNEADIIQGFLGLGVSSPEQMVPHHDFKTGVSDEERLRRKREDQTNLTPPAAAQSPVGDVQSATSKHSRSGKLVPMLSSTSSTAASMKNRLSFWKKPATNGRAPEEALAAPPENVAATKVERRALSPDLLVAPDASIPTASRAFQRNTQSGSVTIRMDQVKQTIVGMGFSNAFYTSYWHKSHPYSSEIYGLFLGDLQPSILRIRNNFGINADADIQIDAEFLAIAKQQLGYDPIVLMSGWSPPAWLKVNQQLNGPATNAESTNVISKDSQGRFRYYDFAQYWVQSLQAYAAKGVFPDYMSPQNEPDYSAPTHATCLFGAQESFTVPGYYEAARNVYDAMHRSLTKPPAMIGPESFGFDRYIAEFPLGGGGIFAGLGNHLYASGTAPDNTYDPYSFTPALARAQQYAQGKGMQNLWMTEYAKLSRFEYQDPLRLAIVMHNTLTVANVTAYLHWDGAWGAPSDGPANEGTLILVENPFMDRSKWQYPKGYRVLHTYWWIKHFTRFIRPTYRRVQCDISGLPNVLASAWTGANGVFSIILINTGSEQANVNLQALPVWIATQVTDRYFSTLDIGFTYSGRFFGSFISIPPLSITSLFSYPPAK